MQKACRNCRLLYEGDACPACQSTEHSRQFEGAVYIVDAERSEVGKRIGAKVPGKYALKIK
jgi:DNA-directed RNA polymerase subunit E"